MRTVGLADIKTHFYTDMHRAFGTLSKVGVIYKGLKPFVTTFFEPTALLLQVVFYDYKMKIETKEGESAEFIIQLPAI